MKLAKACGARVLLVSEPARIWFSNQSPEFPRDPRRFHFARAGTAPRVRCCWPRRCPRFVTTRGQRSLPASRNPTGDDHGDPDQAARAPMGDAMVGDPSGAMDALLPLIKPANLQTSSKSTQAINSPPNRSRDDGAASHRSARTSLSCRRGLHVRIFLSRFAVGARPVTQPRSFYCGHEAHSGLSYQPRLS